MIKINKFSALFLAHFLACCSGGEFNDFSIEEMISIVRTSG